MTKVEGSVTVILVGIIHVYKLICVSYANSRMRSSGIDLVRYGSKGSTGTRKKKKFS